MRRAVVLLLPAALLLAACVTGPSPSPSAAPESPALTPSPSVATPSPDASPPPLEPRAPSMTPAEEALMGVIRHDASVRCAPRRTDLPDGALHGIECRPDDRLVARIGVYAFPSRNAAAFAYMTRLAEAGVDANAGACNQDQPGDEPWLPGDGEGNIEDPGAFKWENSVLSPARIGCFRDANGTANVRATCDSSYIGILGAGTGLRELHDWAWRYPEDYEPGTPEAPGICIGDGLVVPDVP